MRFLSLDLERYGAFTARRLEFAPHARLHIIHGANEAGKTTALSAIADLLFGFETRVSFKTLQDGSLQRLGGCLQLDNGTTRHFRRRRGIKASLVDGAEQPLGEDFLDDIKGNLKREDFRTEFGLTAQALREGGEALLAAKSSLAEMLATGSAGLSALLQLEKLLAGEADERFGERRTAGKPFYRAQETYAALEKQLKEAIVNKPELAAADTLLEARQQAANALEEELKTLEAEKTRLARAKAAGPVLVQLDACRAALQAFAHLPDVPAAARINWRNHLAAHADLARQLTTLGQDHARDNDALARQASDPALMLAQDEIKRLQLNMGAVKQAVEDLPIYRFAARDEAQAKLQDLALRLRLADVPDLLARQPAETEIVALRQQIQRARLAGDALGLAQQTLDERRADVERWRDANDLRPHAPDPRPLRASFEAFASIPQDWDNLAREAAQMDARAHDIATATARLHPAVSQFAQLERLALPSPDSLLEARQQWEALKRAQADLAAKRKMAEAKSDEASAEITSLSVGGGTASLALLAAARRARDQALAALATALDSPGPEKHACFTAAHALGLRADDLADQLIREGALAAKRQVAQARHMAAQADLAKLEGEAALLAHAMADQQLAWQAQWAHTGLVPLDPAAMIAWCENVRGILSQDRVLADLKAKLAALRAALDARQAPLAALARDMGATVRPGLPLDLLHIQCGQHLAALEKAWGEARETAATQKALQANLALAEQSVAAAADRASQVQPGWQQALHRLALSAQASFEEAETALILWQEVEAGRHSLAYELRRIAGIERREQTFAGDVEALANRLGAVSEGDAPMQVLDGFVARLAAAQHADGVLSQLTQTMRQRTQNTAQLAGQQEKLAALLAQAAASMPPDMALDEALELLDQRAALQAQEQGLAQQLRHAAAGRSEAQLRAEFEALGGEAGQDGWEGLMQTALAKAEDASLRYRHAIADQALARQARENLEVGRGGAQVQQALTEAAAQLQQVASQWLVRHAAARLARSAIERHRAQAQHPVVARASALFATVTGGAFAGLVADFDDKDNSTLKGARASGARVAMDEMSEGTRDQLFLVLRLALLEQRRVQSLPFVGDDLLASFDEPRAGNMLKVLAQYGARNQVILFTHHAHVVELALAKLGNNVDVLRL